MKKFVIVSAVLMNVSFAQAQMTDTLGALGVDGLLNAQSYQGFGQMQQAFGRVQLQQDLAMLNLEIQSNFMHGYQNLSRDNLRFDGLRGIDWDVIPDGNGYYIELSGLKAEDCLWCQSNAIGALRIDIPGGCRKKDNTVRLYF